MKHLKTILVILAGVLAFYLPYHILIKYTNVAISFRQREDVMFFIVISFYFLAVLAFTAYTAIYKLINDK